MLTLAVLADDLTGALDTGVQFASAGVKTAVAVGSVPPDGCAVAVCDLETRHMAPEEAFLRTREAVRQAQSRGARYFYGKTDSGLRGNLGAALAALREVDGRVFFAPSYPENGRVTTGGVHLIDGVPVSRSLFGRDARNPVRHDRVADILRETAALPIRELRTGASVPGEAGVYVADAETDGELSDHARHALDAGFSCFAGCAGFAKQLAPFLHLPSGTARRTFARAPLLVVCGSVSPVSLAQLAAARRAGIPAFLLRGLECGEVSPLWNALRETGCAVLASAFEADDLSANDAAGWTAETVAARLGAFARRAVEKTSCGLFVIGGDTLMAAIRALGTCALLPAFEMSSGVVACTLTWRNEERLLVTKSGSFGGEEAILSVFKMYVPEQPSF